MNNLIWILHNIFCAVQSVLVPKNKENIVTGWEMMPHWLYSPTGWASCPNMKCVLNGLMAQKGTSSSLKPKITIAALCFKKLKLAGTSGCKTKSSIFSYDSSFPATTGLFKPLPKVRISLQGARKSLSYSSSPLWSTKYILNLHTNLFGMLG